MTKPATSTFSGLPVLSRGRHRTARTGACFMEFASFLAGERWSDHPACTNAALAHLARGVNDLVSDGARSRLAPLIPSVIGLDAPGLAMSYVVAVRAGVAALPVASETRQRTLAVGLQRCLDELAEPETDAALANSLAPLIRGALSLAPEADRWATRFRGFVGHSGTIAAVTDTLTSVAVVGISEACVDDADDRLITLLDEVIEHCAALTPSAPEPATAPLISA